MDITEVCQEARNYFAPAGKRGDMSYIHDGTYTISGHTVSPLDFIAEGQYFRICGSTANDGVYCNTEVGRQALTDEVFEGQIWEMSVPRAFIALCAEIQQWRNANEAADSANMSPFQSESFAGYSYSKGGSSASGGGNGVTWQTQFEKRLSAWRRIRIV